MREKDPLEITERQGWRELDDSADQAEEVIKESGDTLFGRDKCQEMVIAVRNRNVTALRALAEGPVFPYRNSIREALMLFRPVQTEES